MKYAPFKTKMTFEQAIKRLRAGEYEFALDHEVARLNGYYGWYWWTVAHVAVSWYEAYALNMPDKIARLKGEGGWTVAHEAAQLYESYASRMSDEIAELKDYNDVTVRQVAEETWGIISSKKTKKPNYKKQKVQPVGLFFKRLRKDSEQTLSGVAKTIGISVSLLSYFESGKRSLSLQDFNNLCKHFDVTSRTDPIIKSELEFLKEKEADKKKEWMSFKLLSATDMAKFREWSERSGVPMRQALKVLVYLLIIKGIRASTILYVYDILNKRKTSKYDPAVTSEVHNFIKDPR